MAFIHGKGGNRDVQVVIVPFGRTVARDGVGGDIIRRVRLGDDILSGCRHLEAEVSVRSGGRGGRPRAIGDRHIGARKTGLFGFIPDPVCIRVIEDESFHGGVRGGGIAGVVGDIAV